MHPITGEAILYAPDRAMRPNAFAGAAAPQRCPFCPGHEADTPPEIMRYPESDRWTVRVVPNKYPAAEGHEVIIESAGHGTSFDQVEDGGLVLRTSFDRVDAALTSFAYVSLFKNYGSEAGASIDHAHSQLIPLSFLPPRVVRERQAFLASSSCPLCAMTEGHSAALAIQRTEHFFRIAPEGSTFPFQQWIVPREHRNTFTGLSKAQISELSAMLSCASRGMLAIADSYNWMFAIFPGCESAHAYLEAFPRITCVAGFELATGSFIDIIDPAAAALHYRTIDASSD